MERKPTQRQISWWLLPLLNYDSRKNHFDTSAVEAVIQLVLKVNPKAVIVIKSTIPVGYTESIRQKFGCKILFSALNFSCESKALYDNLYPSRIIVSCDKDTEEAAHTFVALLQEGAIKENIDTLFMGFTEAEAVKLFANTYLALRVSYFNELDTYAEMKGLNTKGYYRRSLPDPRIRNPLQQPFLWLRRLLSSQRYQAALPNITIMFHRI